MRDRGVCSLLLVLVIVVDLEITELVGVLAGGNNSKVLTHLLLLQVLLGEVLEIALAEVNGGIDDEGVLVLGDGDGGSEVASLSFDLDSLGKEALEIAENDNIVFNWHAAVDNVLSHLLLSLGALLCLVSFLILSLCHREIGLFLNNPH